MSRRTVIALSLLPLIPIGLLTRVYMGPGEAWIRHYLGGIFYEIFWCLVAGWIYPNARPAKISVWIFFFTGLLEILQLWHPIWLQAIRSHVIAQILVGTTFDVWDFPHYAIGCVIGWRWLKGIQNSKPGDKTP